jgi:hypothetical protein
MILAQKKQHRLDRRRRRLRRFRVCVQSTEWFLVDVLARDATDALQIGESVDIEYLRSVDSEWQAVTAEEVAAGEAFDPPEIPLARGETPEI